MQLNTEQKREETWGGTGFAVIYTQRLVWQLLATDMNMRVPCHLVFTDFRQRHASPPHPGCWAEETLGVTWSVKAEKFPLLQSPTCCELRPTSVSRRAPSASLRGNHLPYCPPPLHTTSCKTGRHTSFLEGRKPVDKFVVTNAHTKETHIW